MDGIRSTFRYLISAATKRLARYYTQKDRYYRYKKFRLKILKGVFHPGLYRSSKVMAGWLEQQRLEGLHVLEIGSGSGLLSIVAAAKGALVTAIDTSAKAIECTRLNATTNGQKIHCIQSDLFDALPGAMQTDMVIINPPYYPREPETEAEKAWFCGTGFRYFERLFTQLRQRGLETKCYMILSDTCDLAAIAAVALQQEIKLETIYEKRVSGEWLHIYRTLPVTHQPLVKET